VSFPSLAHTKIIGVGHKARQGKDLAASLLEELAPGRVRRFACADALYAHCRIAHGMTKKDSVLLQDVGLNWRERDPDVWVRACLWSIQNWDADARGPQVAVITDVRFPNEAAAILNLGGALIRIRRIVNGEEAFATDRPRDHISETALDDFPWPHAVDNDGTVEEFKAQLDKLARRLAPAVFGPDEDTILMLKDVA
jgi:hypothetical protein